MRPWQPWARALASVTAATTMAQLPVFLVGAAAPNIRRDLHFDSGQLGLVVSAFWMAMAVGGLLGARLANRVGAVATIYLGIGVAAVALLGLALAPSWAVLLLFATLGGLGSAVTTPAGDMALFAVLPVNRLGFAYGVKQASLPAASLLAGGGVPVLVLTVGWRWAFLAGLLLGLPALLLMPRDPTAKTTRARTDEQSPGTRAGRLNDVVPVAVAVGLAMSGVSAMGAFYVESAVNWGDSSRLAGTLLAVGGVCGISGRFLFSWRLGHLNRPYLLVAVLMGLGGVGAVAFAVHGQPIVLVAGTVIAFGAGWGWNGLLTQTVVASHPAATARASAYIMVGAAVGGVAGPTMFGVIVGHVGYTVAWLVCAGEFLAAAAVLALMCGTRKMDHNIEDLPVLQQREEYST